MPDMTPTMVPRGETGPTNPRWKSVQWTLASFPRGGPGPTGQVLPEVLPWGPPEEEEGAGVADGVGGDVPTPVRPRPQRIGGAAGGPLLAQGSVEAPADVSLPEEELQPLLSGTGPDQRPEHLQEIFPVQIRHEGRTDLVGLLRPGYRGVVFQASEQEVEGQNGG
jgi:hypothetical protein